LTDYLPTFFADLTGRDLFSPMLVFIGLLLNGLYFNRKLESHRGKIGVIIEGEKDTQRLRKETFFRLGNAASIATSAAKEILNSSKHPDRLAMIDSFLPSLTQLWSSAKAIDAERSNINLSRDDIEPYSELVKLLINYFFMLDNNQMGKSEYVLRLTEHYEKICRLSASMPEHARKRLVFGLP
jgi:hypothetical protein